MASTSPSAGFIPRETILWGGGPQPTQAGPTGAQQPYVSPNPGRAVFGGTAVAAGQPTAAQGAGQDQPSAQQPYVSPNPGRAVFGGTVTPDGHFVPPGSAARAPSHGTKPAAASTSPSAGFIPRETILWGGGPQPTQAGPTGAQQPQYPATTSATTVQVSPGETAEGIISRLIGRTDTPYMQRAMAIAQQRAAERGLQSSSIAAGAGAQAAIDAAMPIAQIDAGNYAVNARQNAAAQNDFARQGNDFAYDVRRGFIQQDLTKELRTLDAQLDLNTRQLLLKATSEIEGSNTGKQALINTTGKYTSLVNQIRLDPDLSADEKAGAIADLQMDWTEESRRISMIYKIDIPPEYLPTPG